MFLTVLLKVLLRDSGIGGVLRGGDGQSVYGYRPLDDYVMGVGLRIQYLPVRRAKHQLN